MSRTKSSAFTFFNGSTRMDTSWGFSVSSRLINRWTSGNFVFCAATMIRLEILSGQILTEVAPPGPGAEPGDGVGVEDSVTMPGWGPPGNGELPRMDGDGVRDGAEGGAGCEFRMRLSRLPNSSASAYFNE